MSCLKVMIECDSSDSSVMWPNGRRRFAKRGMRPGGVDDYQAPSIVGCVARARVPGDYSCNPFAAGSIVVFDLGDVS